MLEIDIKKGREFVLRSSQIAGRVNTRAVCRNQAIAAKAGFALQPDAFARLMEKGYCFFKAGRSDLLMIFREQMSRGEVKVNLDIIDPRTKRTVGILDFAVSRKLFGLFGRERAIASGVELLPNAGFSQEAEAILVRHGFKKEELVPSNYSIARWPPVGSVGFWVAEGHRQKDGAADSGFSSILMTTALKIVKGLGIDIFEIEDVGMAGSPESTTKLMKHYAREFGAEINGPTSMLIKL